MSYSSEVLADSPAVYWRLGETSGTSAVDASGNGRHGTYTGAYTLNQTSLNTDPTGKSVALVRGVNGGVITSSVGGSVSAFTLEGWVKTGDGNGAFVIGRDHATVNADRLFWLWVNGVTPRVSIQYPLGSGSYVEVSAGASLTVGSIHHLAATYDGTTVRLYVDGAQAGTSTAVSGALNSGATVSSGGVSIYSTTTGNLQDVAYYTTALSAARIAAHYAAGTASGTDARIGALRVEAADQDGGDLRLGGLRVEAASQGVTVLRLGGLRVEAASTDPLVTAPLFGVWDGAAWADGAVRVWDGTAWEDAAATRSWNGTEWTDTVVH